jgi:chromosome segregation ATPase
MGQTHPPAPTMTHSGGPAIYATPLIFPAPADTTEVVQLRTQVSDLTHRFDVVVQSLEKVVREHTHALEQVETLTKRCHGLEAQVASTARRLGAMESSHTTLTKDLRDTRVKADVAYHNSTAEDDANEYMQEQRRMADGDDVSMTGGQIQAYAEKMQAARRNRTMAASSHLHP